jgi:hypothetical protein
MTMDKRLLQEKEKNIEDWQIENCDLTLTLDFTESNKIKDD